MNKTVVINIVGLSARLIGAHTPFLQSFTQQHKTFSFQPAFPAVTTTAQYTYLTGKSPSVHGIVGNGWYFRDECEVKFWRQSNRLVQSPKIWEKLKELNPAFTCANMFWWYNMYSNVDFSVTPRPLYPADGRKIPDVYADPMSLRYRLQHALGPFPLFKFWGPATDIAASRWIANASKLVDQWHNPTLTFIYLPHLDYCLQKFGNTSPDIQQDLREIDDLCKDLVNYYQQKGAEVILLSEYGITNVDTPVSINRLLRKHGYLKVKEELGRELLDAGASRAFAVADHQIAHIYVKSPEDIEPIKALLSQYPGIQDVLDQKGKDTYGINHPRSGELIAIASPSAWFTYYYWHEDEDYRAPDFARTVDIHRKPGYDPLELFIDPSITAPKLKAGWKLLKKKMGFRTLMDLIPLDPSLVKGSHGRIPESPMDWPLIANTFSSIAPPSSSRDIYRIIADTVMAETSTVKKTSDVTL